jgi:BolA protein
MKMHNIIEQKIVNAISLVGLDVIDESHMHNVPLGSESHFKLIIISNDFEGEKLIRRHQRINNILSEELRTGIHALAIQALTHDEWVAKGGKTMPSPKCLGGSKENAQ